jgi:sugar phosphate isomerase/epimerase
MINLFSETENTFLKIQFTALEESGIFSTACRVQQLLACKETVHTMIHMFSLAHLTLQHCSLDEFVGIAARTGYDFVSLRMTKVTESDLIYPLITDKRLRKQIKGLIASYGLRVLDVELITLPPETEPESYTPFLAAAADLGAHAVIVQIPDPDRQRAVDRYARLCELANSYDLYAVLEFVSWTQTADLRSAASIVKSADKGNGGILVDMLHFDRSGSNLEDLEKLPAEWFRFVHLCDAPRATPSLTEGTISTARSDRRFPGKGDLKIGEVLRRLPNVPYSLEIPNKKLLDKLGHEEYARQAIDSARQYLANEFVHMTKSHLSAEDVTTYQQR